MERLSIGDLARATGLTVRAVRHYQDLGLLVPAGVDPATRYRAYGPEQLERALAIARLRHLGRPGRGAARLLGRRRRALRPRP
jgi:DNA-binding transcriptional MerR regulator